MALTERLDIIINASGSKALREFSTVGKAAASEIGKVEKAGDGLTTSLGRAGTMAKVGLAAGLLAGAGALKQFADVAVNAASDLGEQQAATNTIFGDGAKVVNAYAKTAATSAGISERAALEAANGFGDLFLNLGMTSKQAGVLSIGLVQLAGDLASFKNLSTDDVLGKLMSGLVGETEGLRSLGIVINESAVKSKAMELGLGAAHRELNEGEKVVARYALILEKSKNAQGDVARTSDSLANRQRRLQAELENTNAKLGEKVIPVYSNTVKALSDFIKWGSDADGTFGALGFRWEKNASTLDKFGQALGFVKREGSDADRSFQLLTEVEIQLGLAAGTLAGQTDDLASATKLAAAAAEEHAKQVEKQNTAMLTAMGAELGYERSLNSLEDSYADVVQAQKDLAAVTAQYGRNSDEARWSTEQLSRKHLDLEGSILQSAESYAALAEKAAIASGKEWNAVEAAKAQIAGLQRLREEYPQLAILIDTYIKKLGEIPGVVETTIRQRTNGDYASAGTYRDKNGHVSGARAAGGPVMAGRSYLVGENGPEILQMGRSGYVHANGSWGGSSTTVNVYMPPGSDGDDVVNAIQRYERRNGKGWRAA